jgi:hypothetical protein
LASLLINRNKLRDPENLDDSINNYVLAVMENLYLLQLGKENGILYLKESFPENFPLPKLFHPLKLR